MCLEILVRIDKEAAARISAKRLGRLVSLVVKSGTLDGEPALHLSVSGGCSCEFLSNEAPSDEPTWDLDATHREKLEAVVRTLSSEAKRFSVLFHWLSGEVERTEMRVSPAELMQALRSNAVGNNVLYRVGSRG